MLTTDRHFLSDKSHCLWLRATDSRAVAPWREVVFSVVPLVVSQTEQQSISLTYLLLRIPADLINVLLIISEVQGRDGIVCNDGNDALMVWAFLLSFKNSMNHEGRNHNPTGLLDFSIWGYCHLLLISKHVERSSCFQKSP